MNKMLINKNGFSVVEVLVTVMIFMILSGGLYAVLVAGDTSWQVNQVKIDLQQEMRKAIDWMKIDLRQAMVTNVGTSWATQVEYNLPNGVVSGGINWDNADITIKKNATGIADLTRTVVRGGVTEETKVIAQNVNTIQFRRNPASTDLLDIEIQGAKLIPKRDPSLADSYIYYDVDYSLQLRNM